MTVIPVRPAALAVRTGVLPRLGLSASVAALDLAVIATSTVVAVLARERLTFFTSPADISSGLALVGPLLVLVWAGALHAFGSHRLDLLGAGTEEYKRVLNASVLAAGLVGVGCYVSKYDLSRGFFLLLFLVGIPALVVARFTLRRVINRARSRGALARRVLIAGDPANIDEIAAVLRRETWLGYHVVGALTSPEHRVEETTAGVPVLGRADEVSAMLAAGVDVVIFAGGGPLSAVGMRRIAWELESHDVRLIVAPSVTDIASDRVRIRPVGGLPLVHLDPPRWAGAVRGGKRAFDVVGSATALLLLSPVFAVAALRIALHDRGPVLFRQTRIGRGGEEFACLKFRTMVVDAERHVARLQAQTGQQALLFKMKEDPRITAPGRFLRRYSLDELPQLVNVLRGDMSLVGPRPQVASEVALYDGAMSRRLRVRPGMTGLWQVSGRNDLTPVEAIRLDLYYVDNWSMVQDLAILARTVGAVLGSRGAY